MRTENAFTGLTVLDMTRYLPGAYATQLLADWGAEVIKVEDTGLGDFSRHDFPTINDVSYYFTALCRNKKSVSFNLKDEEVRAAFLELVKTADVIVESFRPGVTKRLGVDYESVRAVNPRIIYCSYSAFGQDDPRSQKALHDINMQAQSGYLSLNGGRSSPIHLCDIASAMVAAQGILAALFQRDLTGAGADIDVSMYDSFVWWNSMVDSRYHFNGEKLEAQDLEYPAVCYNIYDTADGHKLSFGLVEAKFWKVFCTEVGAEDLIPVQLCRRQEAGWAFEKMERLVASRTLAEWMDWLDGRDDICVEPVLEKGEAIRGILETRPEMMRYCDFPATGRVIQTNIPHRITGLEVSLDDVTPPPALGENTEEILQRLGHSPEQVASMKQRGAVRGLDG